MILLLARFGAQPVALRERAACGGIEDAVR
jgi:hypothetical protein